MRNGQRVEKTVGFLIAWSVCGVLCSFDEAWSEEVVIPLSADSTFPKGVSSLSPSLFQPTLPQSTAPSLPEDSFAEPMVWPNLPEGKEVAVQYLEGRFLLGKKALGFIHHPGATISMRTNGRLKDYFGDTKTSPRFLTDEEKIDQSLEFAESVADSVQQIPLLGDFLMGCLTVGRDVEKVNRKIKTKYRLHLNYSDSTYLAAFKESF